MQFRTVAVNLCSFLAQFLGVNLEETLDVDKCRVLSSSITTKFEIPRRFRMLMHKALAIELVQFQRIAEFTASLRGTVADSLLLDKKELAGVRVVSERYTEDIRRDACHTPYGAYVERVRSLIEF